MLVLSRRKDETIMIGDEIEITIVDVRGDAVRLGIKAPRSVSVHRKEIYDAIQAENIAAAKGSIPGETTVDGLGSLFKADAAAAPAKSSGLGKLSGDEACPNAPKVKPPAGLDKLTSKMKLPER